MFGTKRADDVKVACPRGNLADSDRLRDAALPGVNNGVLIKTREPRRPKPTLKSIVCESFVNYTDSNFGTTMGEIIYEYARPPTDREKLVWILADHTTTGINFNCDSLLAFSQLSLTIVWNQYKDTIPFEKKEYTAVVQFRKDILIRTLYFDDMLPFGRAQSIIINMRPRVPEYVNRIGSVYMEKMRELYAKY